MPRACSPCAETRRSSTCCSASTWRTAACVDDLRREGEQYGRDTGRHRAVRDTGSQRQQRRSEHLDLLGRRAGVEFLNPFLDRRVIEVAASLPGEMIFARGETKVALRRTMEGRLPSEVIGKRIPTARGGPYAFGLGADGGPDIVRRLFADPALARIGVVDAAKLRQAHERFLAGDGSQLTRLVSAVGGEIWLRRETGEPPSRVSRPSPALDTPTRRRRRRCRRRTRRPPPR